MTALPWLTVGVPTRGRPEQLRGLLDLLAAEAPALRQRWRVEVVVADGTPSDRPLPAGLVAAVDVARRVPVRGGVSTGRNALARAAAGDVLLLVDDDVRPRPGALAALADDVRTGTAVAGRVLGLGHRPGQASELMVVGRSGYGRPAGDRPADYAVSALLGLPRDVFTTVEWDEHFAAAHLDDVVYGLRLRAAGVPLAVCTDAVADHPPRRWSDKDRPELAGHRAVVVVRRFSGDGLPAVWLRCLAHVCWTQRRSARDVAAALRRYTAATVRERSVA